MKTWGSTIERYFLARLSDDRNMRVCACIVWTPVFVLCVCVCFCRRPCGPALVGWSICLSNWLFCDSMHARQDVLVCKQQVYVCVCVHVCMCTRERGRGRESSRGSSRRCLRMRRGLKGGETWDYPLSTKRRILKHWLSLPLGSREGESEKGRERGREKERES